MADSCRFYCLLAVFAAVLVTAAADRSCSKKDLFGSTIYIRCPQPGDSPDKTYCCGSKSFRKCCSAAEFSDAINTIGLIVGVLVSIIVLVVIVVVVSCFCCSCCLLAKRRQQRGRVLYQPATTGPTTVVYPTQQAGYPTQTVAYPTQPGVYPTQPGSYPTQPGSYPQQPYQQQYGPPSAGFHPQGVADPPPYPGANDQLPYNPGYGK